MGHSSGSDPSGSDSRPSSPLITFDSVSLPFTREGPTARFPILLQDNDLGPMRQSDADIFSRLSDALQRQRDIPLRHSSTNLRHSDAGVNLTQAPLPGPGPRALLPVVPRPARLSSCALPRSFLSWAHLEQAPGLPRVHRASGYPSQVETRQETFSGRSSRRTRKSGSPGIPERAAPSRASSPGSLVQTRRSTAGKSSGLGIHPTSPSPNVIAQEDLTWPRNCRISPTS